MTYPAYQDDQRKINEHVRTRPGAYFGCGHKNSPSNTLRKAKGVGFVRECRVCDRKSKRHAKKGRVVVKAPRATITLEHYRPRREPVECRQPDYLGRAYPFPQKVRTA